MQPHWEVTDLDRIGVENLTLYTVPRLRDRLQREEEDRIVRKAHIQHKHHQRIAKHTPPTTQRQPFRTAGN